MTNSGLDCVGSIQIESLFVYSIGSTDQFVPAAAVEPRGRGDAAEEIFEWKAIWHRRLRFLLPYGR